MTWNLPALLLIREEGVLLIFIALKNMSPWPGFEPAIFGSSGQQTNHYTTTATKKIQIPQRKIDFIKMLCAQAPNQQR
jgi:hypothetical protein